MISKVVLYSKVGKLSSDTINLRFPFRIIISLGLALDLRYKAILKVKSNNKEARNLKR